MNTRLLWTALTGAVLFSVPSLSLGQARIVGGTKAPANTYRWIVALAEADGGSLYDRQFCGASLISPDWVLTAAHCVEGEVASRIQVVVGLSDLENTSSAQIRGVRGIYMHPAYADVQGDLLNDIALLLLDAPVTTITPISYARSPSTAFPGMTVRAIGWGDTLATPRYPTELRMVDLDIVSIDFANRAYGVSRYDSRHLAAMAAGKDTCSGDSGGPLFDTDGGPGGSPLLLGITSFGLDCAQRGIPGIYANVGNFATWIDGFLEFDSSASDPSMALLGNGERIPSGSPFPKAGNLTDFGRPVPGGRSRVRRFVVSNVEGSIPLSISGVRFSNRAFTAISYPRYLFGGSSGVVGVRYRAPSSWRGGRSQARMYILNNDPANPFYTVTLRARYQADWW
jgi:secreted trypsin-like serine protease